MLLFPMMLLIIWNFPTFPFCPYFWQFSWRDQSKCLRAQPGDCPASCSLFIWISLLFRCSLSVLTKPHSCSNAWLFLGRVLGGDENEHLQTLWTVSWTNGRKLKDTQTAGIIDFITIWTAPSAAACKRSSSFINWLFQGSKACQGNN